MLGRLCSCDQEIGLTCDEARGTGARGRRAAVLRVGATAGRGAPKKCYPMLSQTAADFCLLSITEL